jgi:hypothetical protein
MSMLTAGVLSGAGAGQALGATPTPTPGRTTATVETCHPAADLASRYATFAAQMSAVPGTAQMSIRLELDERTPADLDFLPLSGVPGFGVWKSSAPGVDIFGYSQEVSSLSSPASFRVTVNYRWIGPHHRVIRRARRMTPACSLPRTPASLVVGTLSRSPAASVVGKLCGGQPASNAAADTPAAACQ